MLKGMIRKMLDADKGASATYRSNSWFDCRRQRSEPVGLARDLYPLFDLGQMLEPFLKDALEAPNMLHHLRRDDIPLPAPMDREGYYGDRHFCYWLSGLYDFNRVMSELPEDFSLSRILDLGGSSGRVARHFVCADKGSEVIVTDLNVNYVEWIEEYFPPIVKGLKVSGLPGVPLGDESVDLCCAFSVFTHIDAYETSWIAEIARLLRPGGRAYLTIHSEHTWSFLPDIHLFNALKDNDSFKQLFRKGSPMPSERLVFEHNPDLIDYNCNVFHHSDYIRRRWNKWLNVMSVIPRAHADQAVVICEKA